MTATITALDWARDVARELGPDWSPALPDHHTYGYTHAHLHRRDGARLSARVGGWRNEDRVEITWSFDYELSRYSHVGETRKSITVSAEKTAKRAAGDITRRLLPGLDEVLTALRERKAVADAEQARRDAFIAQASATLDRHVNERYRNHRPHAVYFGEYSRGGTVSPYLDGSAEITVVLPREGALRVLATIAEVLDQPTE